MAVVGSLVGALDGALDGLGVVGGQVAEFMQTLAPFDPLFFPVEVVC